MRNIFVYIIFSFLLFVSTFSSEVISLNQKRTEKLTSKKQFYSLSTEGEELNKKNVLNGEDKFTFCSLNSIGFITFDKINVDECQIDIVGN